MERTSILIILLSVFHCYCSPVAHTKPDDPNTTNLAQVVETMQVHLAKMNTALSMIEEKNIRMEAENNDMKTELSMVKTQLSEKLTPAVLTNATVPLGTILAWVPRPNHEDGPYVNLPDGWMMCNGDIILHERSPWRFTRVPDLNSEDGTGRFLRGGPTSLYLEMAEDQLEDHVHIDFGHSHSDLGHTHADDGHTHEDSGHTHVDQGHTHTDSGHTHSYGRFNYQGSGGGFSSGSGYDVWEHSTSVSSANIQSSNANIASNTANIQLAKAQIEPGHSDLTVDWANMAGVDEDFARAGTETRPKTAYIVWVIKIAEN